ncbi:Lrp/AsnC family transcriptional regulator [Pseudomonas sp. St316]|uniref:Lrp/AsnC family transcriptional regulator n=1 Tax=Pseudomonas sp. St316 TaxID=2678257 RepID=UPI001BB3C74C|nr:Lrp/AsnC family transcriptional regulator [Pseudomonas sp. St316]BBP58466.1 AsnC family transcriptional regulator [Pseudomonas sp. St316]
MKKNSDVLDAIDLAILNTMQRDAKTTTSHLASQLCMTETPCWRRLKRLEEEGYISRYEAILDKAALGYNVTAFVHLSVDTHTEEATRELEEKITSHPGVYSLHNVTGDYDFLVHIHCKSIDAYNFFIENTLRGLSVIRNIKTSISLREITRSNHLYI